MEQIKTARRAAADTLLLVEKNKAYSNIALGGALEQLPDPRERSFASALFYGVLTRKLTLDYAVSHYSKIPLKKLDAETLTALEIGFYQLMYMPNIAQSAAVNETAALAPTRSRGFANALLRSFIRAELSFPMPKDKLTALSVEYSVPPELIRLWRKSYGHEKTLEILKGTLESPKTFLITNTLNTDPKSLMASLCAEGIETEAERDNIISLRSQGKFTDTKAFKEGLFHVQDISSAAAVKLLSPRPGSRVLDVCAAPGGKSFTMAELMEGKGEIVACDLYSHRLALVAEGARRLGINIIKTQRQDATEYNEALGEFDFILCDAVCSGFGIIRRKPEIRYKSLKDTDGLGAVQLKILKTAARYIKKGGKILYSTCTLNPAENEEVVKKFLEERQDMKLSGDMKTFFTGENGGDGFFCALMERL